MAVYKVPQDVEAEDKLIGPFSFRQFIYLIIVAIGLFLMWALGQLFLGLAIIPLPFVIFFGALALPLRKDQPTEVYLTAVIKFFLKPKVRLWSPDGSISMVTITAPKAEETMLTKGYGGEEAQQRLAYLSRVVDTQGWSTRGVSSAPNSLDQTLIAEASKAEDILDENAGVVQSFDQLISREDTRRRQAVVTGFQQQAAQPLAQAPDPVVANVTPQATNDFVDPNNLSFNPYPSSMHQRILSPSGSGQDEPDEPVSVPVQPAPAAAPQRAPEPPKIEETPAPSPDIMRLANNNDLSISAIAREAHRLEEKNGEEVVISLR